MYLISPLPISPQPPHHSIITTPDNRSPGPGLSYRIGSHLWPPGFRLPSALRLALRTSARRLTGGRGWGFGLLICLFLKVFKALTIWLPRPGSPTRPGGEEVAGNGEGRRQLIPMRAGTWAVLWSLSPGLKAPTSYPYVVTPTTCEVRASTHPSQEFGMIWPQKEPFPNSC